MGLMGLSFARGVNEFLRNLLTVATLWSLMNISFFLNTSASIYIISNRKQGPEVYFKYNGRSEFKEL